MKVFLGGTCNGSNWRDRFIPMLKDVDYFNPVVDTWTPDCQSECKFCLYVITPKMKGVYSIAEVVDDSNKKQGNTVLVILREDEGERFDDSQWGSICAVAEMVEQNGTKSCGSLEEAAEYINTYPLRSLQKAGILGADGKLTPYYRRDFEYGDIVAVFAGMHNGDRATVEDIIICDDVKYYCVLFDSDRREGQDDTDFYCYYTSEHMKLIQSHNTIILSPEDQIKFVDLLLNPPEPNDALKRAFAKREELFGE